MGGRAGSRSGRREKLGHNAGNCTPEEEWPVIAGLLWAKWPSLRTSSLGHLGKGKALGEVALCSRGHSGGTTGGSSLAVLPAAGKQVLPGMGIGWHVWLSIHDGDDSQGTPHAHPKPMSLDRMGTELPPIS